MNDTFSDIVRLILFALSIYLLLRLLKVRRAKWKTKYTEKEKRSWTSFLMIALTIGVGNFEKVLNHADLAIGTLLSFFALVSVIWVTHTKDDRYTFIFNEPALGDDDGT